MRKLYIDIEVLQEGNFPDVDKADKPIIMVCLYDNYLDKYFIVSQRKDFEKSEFRYDENTCIALFSDEKEMLTELVDFISKLSPDVIIGWNILKFDIPYLINRMKRLDIDYTKISPIKRVFIEKKDNGYDIDVGGLYVFDLMVGYKEIYKPPSYSLKAVAELEGLEGKTEEAKDIDYIYYNEFDRLIKYNKRDVELLVEIDKKKDITGYYENIAFFVGLNDLHMASVPSNNVELMALRIAKMLNVVLPNKPFAMKESYEGGYVANPKIGLYENVLCLDFSRMYPNIILTFNLSPETVSKNPEKPWKEPEGLIPKIVRVLFKVRDKIESEMKKYPPESEEYKRMKKEVASVKQIINGVYGYMAYQRARLRDDKIAATITARAREAIKTVERIVKEDMSKEYGINFEPIYGDSVSRDTKVRYFDGSEWIEETIEEFFTRYENEMYVRSDGKEEINLEKYNILTPALNLENGNVEMKNIKRIIRHKVNKRMFKVVSESGKEVVVTEDHSLVVYDSNLFKERRPYEITSTDKLILVEGITDMIVMFEKIKSIEECNYDGYVYDLEVEDNHTFLANNIFVHNTDSVYVHIPKPLSVDEMIEIGKQLEEKVTKKLEEYFIQKYDLNKFTILLEFEKVYQRIFFVRAKSKGRGGAKKRYAGLIVYEKGKKTSKVDITGFDAIRSNTPKIFKTIQEDVIKLILDGASRDQIIEFIRDFRKKLLNIQFPIEDYGIPVSISKSIEEYKANSPHIRAVLNTKNIFGIEYGKGDKIKFLWLDKLKNKYRVDVIAFTDDDASRILPEFKDSINIQKYDSDLKEKLITILEVVGITWDEIECKKVKLTSFLV